MCFFSRRLGACLSPSVRVYPVPAGGFDDRFKTFPSHVKNLYGLTLVQAADCVMSLVAAARGEVPGLGYGTGPTLHAPVSPTAIPYLFRTRRLWWFPVSADCPSLVRVRVDGLARPVQATVTAEGSGPAQVSSWVLLGFFCLGQELVTLPSPRCSDCVSPC